MHPSISRQPLSRESERGNTYTYDAWNRMASYTPLASGSTGRLYSYEALGQRASVTVNVCGGTTSYSFYSASWQCVEDDVSNEA